MTKSIKQLPVNKKYYIEYFENNFENNKEIYVLDFGCGEGEIVFEANYKYGYRFFGVDNYYGGRNIDTFNKIGEKNLIRLINSDGTLPFSNDFFDFIYSNQVFEHVDNIQLTLNELKRILKKDGMMLHTFPVKEVIIEPHVLIPFFHWFKKDLKLKKQIIKILFYILRNKRENFNIWYNRSSTYVYEYCHYRKKKNILKEFRKRFIIKQNNKEKLIHRLNNKKLFYARLLLYIINFVPSAYINFIEERRGSIEIVCLQTK